MIIDVFCSVNLPSFRKMRRGPKRKGLERARAARRAKLPRRQQQLPMRLMMAWKTSRKTWGMRSSQAWWRLCRRQNLYRGRAKAEARARRLVSHSLCLWKFLRASLLSRKLSPRQSGSPNERPSPTASPKQTGSPNERRSPTTSLKQSSSLNKMPSPTASLMKQSRSWIRNKMPSPTASPKQSGSPNERPKRNSSKWTLQTRRTCRFMHPRMARPRF